MQPFPLHKAFTLLEPGPVVLVTTYDGRKNNVMTITWTMVLDFAAGFAIATGPWNYSYAALITTRQCVLAIPTVAPGGIRTSLPASGSPPCPLRRYAPP